MLALSIVLALAPTTAHAEGTTPSPPVIVLAMEVGDGAFALAWAPSVDDDPRFPQAYRVYRLAAGGEAELVAETTASFFVDASFEPGDPRFYAVTRVNVDGEDGDPTVVHVGGGDRCVRMSVGGVVGIYPHDCLNRV